MANLFIIRELAERKGLTLRDVAAKISISEGGLQKLMANGSTKTSTMEELAQVLEVPAGIFFDDYRCVHNSIANDGSASSIYGNAIVGESDKDKEIAHLKEIIAEKERTIQILMNK